jgi:signal transduction histidine kinase/DNA-binding response OmpR family regulator
MNNETIKILLIEDNPADARLVREALQVVDGSACELTHVERLAEGVRALKDARYDVVMLDLSLPDACGVDTVIHLQNEAPHMPIVVFTELDDDRTAMYAMRIGAQDYLVKSELDGRLLVRTIRYAIERKRMQQVQARYQDQAALNSLATAVSQSLQLEELLEIAIEKVLDVTGCEMAYIRLRNQATGQITLAAHRGLSPQHIDSLLQPEQPVAKRDYVFRSGEVQVGSGSMPITMGGQTVEPSDRLIVRVPLKAKGDVVGVLNIETRRRTSFSKRQLELLKAIGNVIGVGLENARLFTETRRQLDRVEALREISVATASSLDLSRVLNVLLEKIAAALPYSALAIRLFDKASGELRATAAWNIDIQEWRASSGKNGGGGLSAIVFENKSPLAIRRLLSDSRTSRPEIFRRQGLVSYLGLPIIANGEGVGVLSIYTKFEHEFPEDEIRFLATLTNPAGMAIYNSQLYEHTRAQAAELERSNKVKDEFLGVMSHEFRTPLNIILGYCNLMQDRALGDINNEQEQALGKIAARSTDLLAMLSSILEVTRTETDAVPVLRERFDLNGFFCDFRTAHDVRLAKDVVLEWQAPDAGVIVNTDQRKLRLILEQLLTNAIQFTESGKITIAAARGADDKHVSLSVVDTGVGIPEESRALIFEKFTQLDSSTTRAHEGIGLGLYLVRKFVDLLGGDVKVESEPGVGSRFEVTVPNGSDGASVLAER